MILLQPPPVSEMLAKLAKGHALLAECEDALRVLAGDLAFAWPLKAEALEAAADRVERAADDLERQRRAVASLLRLDVIDVEAVEALSAE